MAVFEPQLSGLRKRTHNSTRIQVATARRIVSQRTKATYQVLQLEALFHSTSTSQRLCTGARLVSVQRAHHFLRTVAGSAFHTDSYTRTARPAPHTNMFSFPNRMLRSWLLGSPPPAVLFLEIQRHKLT